TTCADRYTSDIEGRSRRDQFTSKNCGLGFHHNRDHVRGGNKSYCIGNNSSQPENIKIDEAVRKRLGMEENDNGHGGRRTRNHHTENSYISGQSSRQPRHTGQSCITSADVATAAAVAADTFECGEESQLSCNS
ncbi:unnamed protein product, partial [Sphacelaria rigidula]